jgi:FkbM family methyltransferase
LAQVPGLYARLVALRRPPNVEKIIFLTLVRRGDTVLDVGANTGYYTLLFSHLAGSQGRVHAFEPVAPTFSLLASHVKRKGAFDNIVLNERALADRAGPVSLLVPDTDLAQAALVRHAAGSWEYAETIEAHAGNAITLDEYAAGLPALDFLKCDVEGAERLVLQGGEAAIRRFRPMLFLEICPDWTTSFGYEPAEIVQFLADLGYDRFYLADEELHLLTKPESELARLRVSANLLCAIRERHADRLERLRPWLTDGTGGAE